MGTEHHIAIGEGESWVVTGYINGYNAGDTRWLPQCLCNNDKCVWTNVAKKCEVFNEVIGNLSCYSSEVPSEQGDQTSVLPPCVAEISNPLMTEEEFKGLRFQEFRLKISVFILTFLRVCHSCVRCLFLKTIL